MDNFIVRQAKSLDDLQWVIDLAVDEDWQPRVGDVESYFSSNLTQYFYIGELNGQRISCISVVKYGEMFAYVGYYAVVKPHRSKGYGLKTWKHALASVGDECNVALDSLVNMAGKYVKSGFKTECINRRCSILASNAVLALSGVAPPWGMKIIPASDVDFQKLSAYDEKVFGNPRPHLLASWITLSQECSWVAIDGGEVVGYLILRKTLQLSKDGYRINPLFADSTPIARSLLKLACQFVASDSPQQIILIDLPMEKNKESLELVEKELSGKLCFDCHRMYTNGIDGCQWQKVYGITSLETA